MTPDDWKAAEEKVRGWEEFQRKKRVKELQHLLGLGVITDAEVAELKDLQRTS